MQNTLLILDNYDSFTYNLVQLVEQCGISNYSVGKNDKISVEEVDAFDSILLSPGPGIPSEAGIMCDLIKTYAASKKIMGICLGHQAIAECFGAKLQQMDSIMHGIGRKTIITPVRDKIFNGIDNCFVTGRYHSWIVSNKDFPHNTLDITAFDSDFNIMALKHKQFNVRGVQFHPESYISSYGSKIMKNWLEL